MKLLGDNTALTTHECDLGAEWDIKVFFNYTKSTKPEYQDGVMVYPGDDEGVEVEAVERRELVGLDVYGWVEFFGATDDEIAAWGVEIHELINKQAADEADEDMSEGTIWGRGA